MYSATDYRVKHAAIRVRLKELLENAEKEVDLAKQNEECCNDALQKARRRLLDAMDLKGTYASMVDALEAAACMADGILADKSTD